MAVSGCAKPYLGRLNAETLQHSLRSINMARRFSTGREYAVEQSNQRLGCMLFWRGCAIQAESSTKKAGPERCVVGRLGRICIC